MRRDLQCDGLVVTRLDLLDVGNRDEAHFEAPLRLLELAPASVSGDARRRQGVLRSEHVEVHVGHPQQQVLQRCLVDSLRSRDPLVGLPKRRVTSPVE